MGPDPGVSGITAIQGAEEHTNYGDVGSLGMSNHIHTEVPQTVLDSISLRGGIAVLNHHSWFASWTVAQVTSSTSFDGWEIFNNLVDTGGRADLVAKIAAYTDTLLSAGIHGWLFATDDCHNPNANTAGKGWIMVNADANDSTNLITQIKAGNFYSTQGPTLTLTTQDNKITVTTGAAATIAFIGINGYTYKAETSVTSSYYYATGAEKYIRIKIMRDSDSKSAWSNPIWITY